VKVIPPSGVISISSSLPLARILQTSLLLSLVTKKLPVKSIKVLKGLTKLYGLSSFLSVFLPTMNLVLL